MIVQNFVKLHCTLKDLFTKEKWFLLFCLTVYIYAARNRKASNALCTRKEKFSGPGEKFYRNMTDLAGSLVTSSRPQKRPDVV